MNLVRKCSDVLLLCLVERAGILSAVLNIFSELTSEQMVENFSIFSSIDDFSIIKSLELFCKLSLVGELLHYAKNLVVNLLGCIIIHKSFRFLSRIFFYAVGGKFFFKRNLSFQRHQFFPRFKRICVFPINHISPKKSPTFRLLL